MIFAKQPGFLDSEYFVMEDENWHLLPGAPAEVVNEFNAFMKNYKEIENGSEDTPGV